jgi:hypothetical protein
MAGEKNSYPRCSGSPRCFSGKVSTLQGAREQLKLGRQHSSAAVIGGN